MVSIEYGLFKSVRTITHTGDSVILGDSFLGIDTEKKQKESMTRLWN